MPIGQSSLASAVGVGAKNVQFQAGAEVLPRKNLIIGTYDETTFTTVTENVAQLVTSVEDARSRFGTGFMLDRLVQRSFEGSSGVETWVIPQPEEGAAVVATGQIVFSGPATESGTLYLYIAGIAVPVTIVSGDDATAIGDAVVAAVTANAKLPVTAVNAVGTVTFTAKSKGPWGNDISLTFNWGFQEDFPAGVTAVVTDMASGAGIPDIDDALNSLGTGDAANEDYFTDVVHGYGLDSATLGKVSLYVGAGNDYVGLWSKTVTRPFRSMNGDVAKGSSGLSTLIALGNGRKTDRASGIIAAPGSPNHPAELAAWVMGYMSKVNNTRAEESYNGVIISGFIPGIRSDRWTDDYDNRNSAVTAGIGTTKSESNALKIKDTVTFYHPDNVPDGNNGYRQMRNISILQNKTNSVRVNFEQERWQGISIVADVSKVSNITSRQKARDTNAVIDDLDALATSWEGQAWIYTAAYTKNNLTVTPRTLSNGFDAIIPVILSGQGDILDNEIQFDTSIAVLL
jgi:phage tail sheath gpL-like